MDVLLRENLCKMLAICLTPMTADQRPDQAALRSHLRWMVSRGNLNRDNSMMIINGSTAEAHSMSIDERKALLDAALHEIGDEMGIVIGCQHTDINAIVDLMRHAKTAGATCAMILPPYYYATNNETVVDFYAQISEMCDMGIIIYNNVTASGIDIPVSVYQQMIEKANIVGVKECTNSFAKMEEAAALTGDRMVIISGHGIIYEPYSAIAGVQTFNSSEACFAPDYARRVWEFRHTGDYQEVKRMRDNLRPYFQLVSDVSTTDGANGVISLIKYLTDEAGSYMGPGKIPVPELKPHYKNRAKQVLDWIAAKQETH